MDFVKKAASSMSGNKEGGKSEGGKSGDGQDYVDKAFAAGSKQSGYNIDPKTQEKITDGGREAYEKFSGSKVDPKYSN